MALVKTRIGLTVLQWALGAVILIEAVLFVLPGAAHDFARPHTPDFIRLFLGRGEILGCILLLIPRTAIRGAVIARNLHHGYVYSPAARCV